MNFKWRVVTLLCTASALALSSAAFAQRQDDNVETLVVTGSRVISSAANSPTPLTVVSLEQLQQNTPSNIPDALNKLPVFQASSGPRSNTNASQNASGNVLNLRYFGAPRTLVLFDGRRVTPTNANGTVDVDVLPMMLMQRVDVVTGGASAVYGSDAVTGVVNFVLDKEFTGVKIEANSGISTYTDAASYQAGIAAGTALFGGRGHIEGAARHFHSDGVHSWERPEMRGEENGINNRAWGRLGLGTQASPWYIVDNARQNNSSYGGLITCSNCNVGGVNASGRHFGVDGLITPFDRGYIQDPAFPNVGIGGDGVVVTVNTMTASLTTSEAFGRFSYLLNDTTNFYVQASWAEAFNKGAFTNTQLAIGNTFANFYYKNNAFLPAATQAALGNNGTANTSGPASNTFTLNKFVNNQGSMGGNQTLGLTTNYAIDTGIEGEWAGFAWEAYYTHGLTRSRVSNPNNLNNQKLFAANDAVIGPNGSPVCYVSTTAFSSLYPGCRPVNMFGPTALTPNQWDYITEESGFIMTNTMDNIGASISGEIFSLPAGPVKAALSGETRWVTYAVDSETPPRLVDCTGLRLCNPETQYWYANVAQDTPEVSMHVWEFAGEASIPVLRDIPFIASFDVNLAGRFTHYSTSGSVQTWKVGFDYHVNDDVRFRGTTSIDIRAPTLNDLYSPTQLTISGFTDVHVGRTSRSITLATSGNPDLVPEVGRTYTAGIVMTPTFIPGLTLSVDFYRIGLKNAISRLSGNSTDIQDLCEASNGTSPYCDLIVRPLPFSDRTTANYATMSRSVGLNSAFQRIEGLDIEASYGFDMDSITDLLPGRVNLRVMANIQPYNTTKPYPEAPVTFIPNSKGRVSSSVNYSFDEWSIGLQHRWVSNWLKRANYDQYYVEPRTPTRQYLDVTVTKDFEVTGGTLSTYLSIQNVANTRPPIYNGSTGNFALYWLSIGDMGTNPAAYDSVGRYFTIGVRANF